MQKIHIVLTMDNERPISETDNAASGPPDYAAAEAWTRAYADIAAGYGFPVTFFVHPEVAVAQAGLFRELEANGHCLGLHLHAWRFDPRYRCEFGGLTEDQARAMLTEASAIWQRTFGAPPKYFRPGTLSANDSIFRVLAELGFRGGSISLPGRVFPDKHAVWMGAPLDPHRGHAFFRLMEGDLDFANMPITVDCSTLIEKDGRHFYWDLRPDFPDVDHKMLVRNAVDQIMRRKPAVPCINLLTHNDNDFTDPENRVQRNFRTALDEIVAACQAANLQPVGATLAQICDLVLAQPAVEKEFDPSGGRVIFDTDDRSR